MGHNLHQHRPENRVTAVFEAGVFSFKLSDRETLAHLSGRLAYLEEHHGEALTAVKVNVSHPRHLCPPSFSRGVAAIQQTVLAGSRIGVRT